MAKAMRKQVANENEIDHWGRGPGFSVVLATEEFVEEIGPDLGTASKQKEYEYDIQGDLIKGSCGAFEVFRIPRYTAELYSFTEKVKERADGYGFVFSAMKSCPEATKEALIELGWIPLTTYKGQYSEYKMTFWGLVLKPWDDEDEEDEEGY